MNYEHAQETSTVDASSSKAFASRTGQGLGHHMMLRYPRRRGELALPHARGPLGPPRLDVRDVELVELVVADASISLLSV